MHKLVKTLHFGITRPHSFRAIKTSKSQLFPLNLFMVNLGILLNKAWGLKNGGGGVCVPGVLSTKDVNSLI